MERREFKRITEEEADHAESAIAEHKKHGDTALRCLKFGTHYVLTELGNSYKIECGTPGCFYMVARRI